MRKPSLDSIVAIVALIALSLVGCSGNVRQGGSESNFLPCSSDTECPGGGACVMGRCASATGGTGALDASVGRGGRETIGAGGTGSGGVGGVAPVDAGCSAGGWSAASGGITGSGGAIPPPPTCPVDAAGIATVDQATLCGLYRCPDAASTLLSGLSCGSQSPTVSMPVIRTGCGFDVVTISDQDLHYTAAFDTVQKTLVAIEVRTSSPSGPCSAVGYRFGTMPAACPSATVQSCAAPTSGPYAGCRDPGSGPGCMECCARAPDESGCTFSFSQNGISVYDTSWSTSSPCPCNCPSCATCTASMEDQLRTLPDRPECNCPAPPPAAGGSTGAGGFPGTGGSGPQDPCDGYCAYRNQLVRECPGVLP